MKKTLSLLLAALLCLGSLSFALADEASNAEAAQKAAAMSFEELLEAAKAEGQVYSVGMPDEWANWKDLWAHIRDLGIKTSDTDMSSAEELAQFALKGKANADIGDIGIAMTAVAVEQDLLLPFKTSYWDSIPSRTLRTWTRRPPPGKSCWRATTRCASATWKRLPRPITACSPARWPSAVTKPTSSPRWTRSPNSPNRAA